MRHRLLLLCAVVAAGLLFAAAGSMSAVEPASESTTTASTAPQACPALEADAPPDMEPVTCSGGCPTISDCEFGGQACQCPAGPGHCVICPDKSFKCVRN